MGAAASPSNTFDINDTSRIKHTKIGVWDFYQEIPALWSIQTLPGGRFLAACWESTPFLFKLLHETSTIPGCCQLLYTYFLLTVLHSMVPAVSLWYSSQMLAIVGATGLPAAIFAHPLAQLQDSIGGRVPPGGQIFGVVQGIVGCAIAATLLDYWMRRVAFPLKNKIRSYFSLKLLEAKLRLDYHAFDQAIASGQFERIDDTEEPWSLIVWTVDMVEIIVELVTQGYLLINIVMENHEMAIYACAYIFSLSMEPLRGYYELFSSTWAATTNHEGYITTEGVSLSINQKKYRKDIVANNLQDHLLKRWRAGQAASLDFSTNFWNSFQHHSIRQFGLISFLCGSATELAEAYLLFNLFKNPHTLSNAYASFAIVRQVLSKMRPKLEAIRQQMSGNSSSSNSTLKQMYKVRNLPVTVIDGLEPFPESATSILDGVSIEFRNVTFRYPGAAKDSLRNISFRVEKGQLCVIVGSNGSGKSTMLKLLLRIYDPAEGKILIDGRNIRTIRLADLRRTIAVLFQDFAIFPLTVKENIGMGDPDHWNDEHRIAAAAELGGATSVINKLPRGMDSYLESPVLSHFAALPEGTTSLFGSTDLRGTNDHFGQIQESNELSGGESQRLAIARTFMRAMRDDAPVSLLLFDEPSSALDPEAEYELFERLRRLRGSKTMIYSSHRFGNLTRHADLLLYVKDSTIQEAGTHAELLRKGGGYAEMFKLQAKAFAG